MKSVLGVDRVIPGGRHKIHVWKTKNKSINTTTDGGYTDFWRVSTGWTRADVLQHYYERAMIAIVGRACDGRARAAVAVCVMLGTTTCVMVTRTRTHGSSEDWTSAAVRSKGNRRTPSNSSGHLTTAGTRGVKCRTVNRISSTSARALVLRFYYRLGNRASNGSYNENNIRILWTYVADC